MRARLLPFALIAASACAAPIQSAPRPAEPPPAAVAPPPRVDPFAGALAELAAHDAASDWTDAACTELAARFASMFDPPRATALHNAAVAETRCDHDGAALDYARRASAADPDSVPARLLAAHLTAMRAAARRDFAGARRVLVAAIERDGALDDLIADLAQVHVAEVLASPRPETAAFDLAKRSCDEALARAPDNVRVLLARSALAAKERRFADARADIARARALAPGDRALHLDAAAIATALRDFDAADKSYLAALAKGSTDFGVRLSRALALRGRLQGAPDAELADRYTAARQAIDAAIAVAPDRPEGHLHFAILLLDYGWVRARGSIEPTALLALEALTKALELSKDRPEYSGVEARARALHDDIRSASICNFGQTEAERKAAEADAKQRAAAAEAEGP